MIEKSDDLRLSFPETFSKRASAENHVFSLAGWEDWIVRRDDARRYPALRHTAPPPIADSKHSQ